MIRTILDGTKTQTRRIVTKESLITLHADGTPAKAQQRSPYGIPGDRLWVRETYYQIGHWEPVEGKTTKGGRQKWAFVSDNDTIFFDEPGNCRKGRHHFDPETIVWHKRLGRFMPRRASRITLEVKSVRVERLQDISEADAVAEGIGRYHGPLDHISHSSEFPEKRFWVTQRSRPHHWTEFATTAYMSLWQSINGPGSWEANPWVWVITFKRIKQ